MLLKTYDIISDDIFDYWIGNYIKDNHKIEKDIMSKVFIPEIKSKGKIKLNNNSKLKKKKNQKFLKKKYFNKRNRHKHLRKKIKYIRIRNKFKKLI